MITAAAVTAIVFGLATIASGGMVLFGGDPLAAGAIVPFVLWFNFLAGFAYCIAGAGLLLRRAWSRWLPALIATATIFVLLALMVHIATGGAFETRTVGAMILRSAIWIGIAILAFRIQPAKS